MQYNIRKLTSKNDWREIAHIFNYFVKNDIAAYPDETITKHMFTEKYRLAPDYPYFVVESQKKIIGFGYLYPFRHIKTMKHTATLTYFILPEFTGKGIGTELLTRLIQAGKKKGITNFLAHISSLNKGSLRFHKKHGFKQCGRFKNVGTKFGKSFDMVWMQLIRN